MRALRPRLGYLPELTLLSALEPQGDGRWRPLAVPEQLSTFCANAAHDACNWLVPAGAGPFCSACRLNRTIPSLDRSAAPACSGSAWKAPSTAWSTGSCGSACRW